MRDYAHLQTAILLRRLAFQVNRSALNGSDPETIHDLRVAIRRLSRCLQVFSKFYEGRSWKKERKRLSGLMEASAGVRDRDIAIELLAKAGIPLGAAVVRRMDADRRKAVKELRSELERWKSRSFSRKWRADLGL
jgi:CHAD domain-containing protein